jgi:hypothetical protein
MTMTRTNILRQRVEHLSKGQRSAIRARIRLAQEKCIEPDGDRPADYSPLAREVIAIAHHYGVTIGTVAWVNDPEASAVLLD